MFFTVSIPESTHRIGEGEVAVFTGVGTKSMMITLYREIRGLSRSSAGLPVTASRPFASASPVMRPPSSCPLFGWRRRS